MKALFVLLFISTCVSCTIASPEPKPTPTICKAAVQHLGEERAFGSLRLLRTCVCQGLLASQDAFLAYEMMKARGAFLPEVPLSYFER